MLGWWQWRLLRAEVVLQDDHGFLRTRRVGAAVVLWLPLLEFCAGGNVRFVYSNASVALPEQFSVATVLLVVADTRCGR